jgi:hypothetical protein
VGVFASGANSSDTAEFHCPSSPVAIAQGAIDSVSCASWNAELTNPIGSLRAMAADPITDYVLTDHAVVELSRRGLEKGTIDAVLKNPGQRLDLRTGRVVVQSKFREGESEYLLRVFVDIDRTPAEVVTAYRTSKVAKYWREQP